VIPWQCVPYPSASAVGFPHEEALYQVSSTGTFTFTLVTYILASKPKYASSKQPGIIAKLTAGKWEKISTMQYPKYPQCTVLLNCDTAA